MISIVEEKETVLSFVGIFGPQNQGPALPIQASNYMRKNFITICLCHLKLDPYHSLYALSNSNNIINDNRRTLVRINLCI